jgi:hypothetical protein
MADEEFASVRFALVTGAAFTKTFDETFSIKEVTKAIAEFRAQDDGWVEVDNGAWIRLESVVAIEPVREPSGVMFSVG